jgi:transcriptional regulator with XRE-family HTH domain
MILMTSRDPGRNPRQVFGAMVRFYRDQAGLSRAELARQVCKSVSLIQAIELGQRASTAEVTGDLEAALQAGGALAQLREEIGDGLGYQAYPSWFQEWALKEAEAATLRWFEPLVVPGLLQTEDYPRAIFRTRFRITSDEIEERVAARLRRQQVLTRDEPTALWVILDEWVRSLLGSADLGWSPATGRERIRVPVGGWSTARRDWLLPVDLTKDGREHGLESYGAVLLMDCA